MDFGLSEEQLLLQQTVDRFLVEECPSTRLHEIFDGDEAVDESLWRGMIGLGLGGLTIPERHGGVGLGLIDLALVSETLGRRAAPGPFLGHALAGVAIALGGNEEQRGRWLPAMAAGRCLGTVALAEAGGRWDPAHWQARVDGGRVTGAKPWVPCASVADLLVVGVEGGGFALVERTAAGVEIAAVDGVDRTRRLDDVTLESARCEVLERGRDVGARVRDAGLCLVAADAFGGATRCIEMAVDHAKTREQFGVTIGHFQAIKHRLATMSVEVEPSRALFWYAAHAWDAVPADRERAASLAKAHITDRFMQTARDAVEIHGGMGFTWEGDMQIWLKRAMFDRMFLGSPAAHRERVARVSGW